MYPAFRPVVQNPVDAIAGYAAGVRWIPAIAAIAALAGGCRRKTPEAPEAFSDAIVRLFVQFDEDPEIVAENILEVERLIYLGMDVEADKAADRALAPARLTERDVAMLEERPDRDPADALPISVAGLSPHPPSVSYVLQLEVDHRPWEPYSPNHYVRTFLEGEDCWGDRSCTLLRTWNDLTKENFLMTVEYGFYKDFRWIDLALDGGEPRWAYLARSWDDRSYAGDSGKAFIHQGYTIEFWVPRDGRGYVRQPGDENVDGGTWTADSTGGGALRMLTLWSETEFKGVSFPEDAVISTTRNGIDDNFKAADAWLSENY